VRLGTVEKRSLGATIQASARVAYDPDLYNAILEHQQAIANLPKTGSASPFQKEAQNTVRATRLRLRQMGLSDDQVERLSGSNFDASSLLVPKSGGTAWVYADIYAYEAPLVKRGQAVELTSTSIPGRTFSGTVRSIDSVLNPDTRTLRARIEVPKGGGELKPEMYLTASIQTTEGRALAVPKSAILPTGTRQLAFVEVGPGQYEPRDVRLGRETDDYFEVISGLKEGEKVVTSANFLIDSESKLKSAIQGAGQAHDQMPESQP
jgi:Cu(I)/Ag(I) efflux system membrane fusion protein